MDSRYFIIKVYSKEYNEVDVFNVNELELIELVEDNSIEIIALNYCLNFMDEEEI